MLSLIKPISKNKSLYIDVFDKKNLVLNRKNLASIDKVAEMLSKSEDTKMPDIKHIPPKSKYTIFSQLRSRIQSI